MKPLNCKNGHILLSNGTCPACLHDSIVAIEYFAPEHRKNRGQAIGLPKMVRSAK